MSQRQLPFTTQYERPNLIIVPTVSINKKYLPSYENSSAVYPKTNPYRTQNKHIYSQVNEDNLSLASQDLIFEESVEDPYGNFQNTHNIGTSSSRCECNQCNSYYQNYNNNLQVSYTREDSFCDIRPTQRKPIKFTFRKKQVQKKNITLVSPIVTRDIDDLESNEKNTSTANEQVIRKADNSQVPKHKTYLEENELINDKDSSYQVTNENIMNRPVQTYYLKEQESITQNCKKVEHKLITNVTCFANNIETSNNYEVIAEKRHLTTMNSKRKQNQTIDKRLVKKIIENSSNENKYITHKRGKSCRSDDKNVQPEYDTAQRANHKADLEVGHGPKSCVNRSSKSSSLNVRKHLEHNDDFSPTPRDKRSSVSQKYQKSKRQYESCVPKKRYFKETVSSSTDTDENDDRLPRAKKIVCKNVNEKKIDSKVKLHQKNKSTNKTSKISEEKIKSNKNPKKKPLQNDISNVDVERAASKNGKVKYNLKREKPSEIYKEVSEPKIKRTSLSPIKFPETHDTNGKFNIKSIVKIKDNNECISNSSISDYDLRTKLSRRGLNEYFTKLRNLDNSGNYSQEEDLKLRKERKNLIITIDNKKDEDDVPETTKSFSDVYVKKKKGCDITTKRSLKRQKNEKKHKKIKLVIKVTCDDSSSSNDTDEEVRSSKSSSKSVDLSFLDDFNIDEIVDCVKNSSSDKISKVIKNEINDNVNDAQNNDYNGNVDLNIKTEPTEVEENIEVFEIEDKHIEILTIEDSNSSTDLQPELSVPTISKEIKDKHIEISEDSNSSTDLQPELSVPTISKEIENKYIEIVTTEESNSSTDLQPEPSVPTISNEIKDKHIEISENSNSSTGLQPELSVPSISKEIKDKHIEIVIIEDSNSSTDLQPELSVPTINKEKNSEESADETIDNIRAMLFNNDVLKTGSNDIISHNTPETKSTAKEIKEELTEYDESLEKICEMIYGASDINITFNQNNRNKICKTNNNESNIDCIEKEHGKETAMEANQTLIENKTDKLHQLFERNYLDDRLAHSPVKTNTSIIDVYNQISGSDSKSHTTTNHSHRKRSESDRKIHTTTSQTQKTALRKTLKINDSFKGNNKDSITYSRTEFNTYDNGNTTQCQIISSEKKHVLDSTSNKKDIVVLLEEQMQIRLKSTCVVEGLIHKGSYSSIYRCKDIKGTLYAAKITSESSESYENGVWLQRDIIKDDSNCISILNGFTLANRWCFLMEYYPKSLEQVTTKTMVLFHIDLVQCLSKQLVDAVLFLKNNKIVHSDIKPSHILINSSYNRIKLAGFDEAYNVNYPSDYLNIGTVNYRAPEVIMGYSAGFSIDVWSTALVMYELATRSKLFPGEHDNNVLYQHMCVFGEMPPDMIDRSTYKDVYFSKRTFLKKTPNGATVLVHNFKNCDRLFSNLSNASRRKINGKPLYMEQLTKFELLSELLTKMLKLHPLSRMAIETVRRHPFLTE